MRTSRGEHKRSLVISFLRKPFNIIFTKKFSSLRWSHLSVWHFHRLPQTENFSCEIMPIIDDSHSIFASEKQLECCEIGDSGNWVELSRQALTIVIIFFPFAWNWKNSLWKRKKFGKRFSFFLFVCVVKNTLNVFETDKLSCANVLVKISFYWYS